MKTAELTGAKLDYWVARANGTDAADLRIDRGNGRNLADCVFYKSGYPFRPSTHWAHGGPIIERERISICEDNGYGWDAHVGAGAFYGIQCATPLLAAMRAYVASKFGDEVPDEVTT